MELERYYGGAKALLAQNEAFLKGITEALLLTLHHTRRGEQARRVWTDFNPRPPRGGRLWITAWARLRLQISIHAPREGGDTVLTAKQIAYCQFQSTPPARGATKSVRIVMVLLTLFQSTPPARGATLRLSNAKTSSGISIHAPREGGDSKDAQFYLRIFDK